MLYLSFVEIVLIDCCLLTSLSKTSLRLGKFVKTISKDNRVVSILHSWQMIPTVASDENEKLQICHRSTWAQFSSIFLLNFAKLL